jgi:hypothetical protein
VKQHNVPEHVVKKLWNLKLYIATVFEKKEQYNPCLTKFQGKVNIWNEM